MLLYSRKAVWYAIFIGCFSAGYLPRASAQIGRSDCAIILATLDAQTENVQCIVSQDLTTANPNTTPADSKRRSAAW